MPATENSQRLSANASVMPPRRVLAQMLVGNQVQQAIYVAAKLGIADLLKSGPKDISELARAAGAHQDSLYRLLRALTGFGVFSELEPGWFALTPVAALLETGTSGCAFALWSGGVSYQVFGGLEYSVRTGKPAFEHLFGMEFFDYLHANPQTGKLFDELMSWHTEPVAAALAAHDFTGADVLVDVGGGRGELLAAVLNAHPAMQGVLADHPRVAQTAQRYLESAGVANRSRIVCGDIFETVPSGGGVYLLKSVLHGLGDDRAERLLANCHEAMVDNAKLLLVEFVMPKTNDSFPGKLMDLLMLVGGPGRERTESEFRRLLAAAGFRLANIQTIKSAYSLIQAEKA
jgi:hypothetical protein